MLSTDLRFAWRTFLKRPLFSVVVVATLALGIGANSAVFTLANAALFSALPVHAPEELLNVYSADSTRRGRGNLSHPDYRYLREHSRRLSGVAAYAGLMTTLTGQGTPEVLFGEIVSGNYFAVTGARLALGRGFLPSEDLTPGAHPVVVIGHHLWQRRFGGDSSVVGRTITLNGQPFTVVGVADRTFGGLLFRVVSADVWAPMMMMGALRTDHLDDRDERWLSVKARLAPGATADDATAELRQLGAQLATDFPASNRGRGLVAIPSTEVLLHPDGDTAALSAALLVLVLVGFILLIVCTNLANIMLARATARRREIAVRLALGASRRQLVRQLGVESALLALAGGAAGQLLAVGLTRALLVYRPPTPVPINLDIGVDWRVLGYTAALTFLAVLVFGVVPALRATRVDVSAGLSAHDPGTQGGASRLRHAFLIPQVALSLALLVVAGLFVRSVANANDVHPGFDLQRTATLTLNLRLDGYDEARAASFYAALTRRISSFPGVQGVSVTDRIPLDLYGNRSTTVTVPGANGHSAETVPLQLSSVDAGYFAALGIPLVAGRDFTEAEVRAQAQVAVISEQMARRYWPGDRAVGQHLRAGDGEAQATLEVIGVAANVKVQTLGELPQSVIYRPIEAGRTQLLRIVARGTDDAEALERGMRREVSALDPNVAIFEGTTMAKHLDAMLFPFRLAARVSTAMGLFGLLLASVGLYGVVAYGVARRTREIGIRMALGARSSDVLRLVLAGSLRAVAIGLAIGLCLALAIGRLVAGFLFGIGGNDPLTVGGIIVTLATVSAAAALAPAHRATRVHPSVALREE